MQKNNLFSFLLDDEPQASARFARGTRACARGAAAAAAADRDVKEKTNKFFVQHMFISKQKQSYLTVIVGLQDGKIRFK